MSLENRAADPRLTMLAAALLLAAACGGGHEPAKPAQRPAAAAGARILVERLEVPSTVDLFGVVEAERTATVSSRVMAMVTEVRVRAGDAVVEGQTLLSIDPQVARGQLAQASGALAQARAALALAERNHQRFAALAAVDASSALELDMARMQYEQALGAVEQAAGAVASASAVAADSRVVAPFAGRVARRMVEVGDLAAPGRPLLTIESAGTRRLALTVPESVMARAGLAIGGTLPVRIDTRPDLGPMTAVIVETTAGADPASHAFEVRVALPMEGVPSGASGRARVAVDSRSVVAIPEAAIVRRGGLSLVVVIDAEGRPESRVVTLGEPLDNGRVEVLSGLGGGETVDLGPSAAPPAGAPAPAAPDGSERAH